MRKTVTLFIAALLVLSAMACKIEESAEYKKLRELFLTECSYEEGMELAKNSGMVLMDNRGFVSGKERWEAFYENTAKGNSDLILIAYSMTLDQESYDPTYYESIKDQYPKMAFLLLEYNGKEFIFKSRQVDSEGAYRGDGTVYQHLMHFTGEGLSVSKYTEYSFYVLVDDPTLTWEEIMSASLSSYAPSQIRNNPVIMEYLGWKE